MPFLVIISVVDANVHFRAAILTKEQSVIVYYRIHPIGHVQMSKVGDINAKVIAALGLTIAENTPVFMGQTTYSA